MPAAPALAEVLQRIRLRIGRARAEGLNEQDTKATLIEPVLRELGWDVEDSEEVRREYAAKKRDRPVDYALLVSREPRLLLEAKALGENLDDRRWANQIMGYAAVAGVAWIVLTDGNEYRIYKALESVGVEDKLLRKVRVDEDGNAALEMIRLLSKEQMKDHRIDELWKAYFVDRQVGAALRGLLASDDDLAVVNLLRQRTKNLSTEEIRGSLRRCRHTVDFPLSPDQLLAKKSTRRGGARAKPRGGEATGRDGVTLQQLIDAGILRAPVELHCHYKGKDLSARIEDDGSVDFRGVKYKSLSVAGGAARETIIGPRAGGGAPSTNGWTFWKFFDADGEARLIDAARVRYAERSTSAAPSSKRVG